MNISQRQVTIVVLGFQLTATTILWISQLLTRQESGIVSLGTGAAILAYGGLLLAYWRGWDYARHISVILVTILVVVVLPEPLVTTYAPFLILLGPILALVLVGPLWVVGSAVATIGLLLLRSGGVGVYASPTTLLSYAMLVAGLIVSRAITDTTHARARQTEEALHNSEEQYRQMFINNPQPMWIYDMTSLAFLEVNDAAIAHYGYSREEFMNMTIKDIRPSEDIPALMEMVKSRSGPFRNSGIWKHRKKDGKLIDVEITRHIFLFDNNKAVLVRVNDITERKQAEDALRDSEIRYRRLFEAAKDGILILDANTGMILEVNPFLIELLGFSHEVFLGKAMWELGFFKDIAANKENFLELQQKEYIRYEDLPLETAYGHQINVEFVSNVYQVDHRKVIQCNIRDITERKRAEEQLHLQSATLEASANAIVITDREGLIQWANPAFTALTGYRVPEEVFGRNPRDLVKSGKQDQMFYKDLWDTILAGKVWHGELHNRRKDNTLYDEEMTITPVRNEFGEIANFIAVKQDVTNRKHVEEELKRSNAELEQFAYVASHDLQEPLRAVAGMVQLLQQRYQGKLDERADEYIGHAVDASSRMQKLINDLLAYSRVDRQGKPFESVNVESTLNVALANLQVAIRESKALVTHDPLPTVLADSSQLSQVFQNLIGNAIKFRGERPLQIHIRAQELDDFWQFEVRDNGIGIEPQYFDRIFLVFQRLHTRREYPGTGIGLSLCKKIIERHGGTIWVESEPGDGSIFFFTLPNGR